MKSVTTKDDDDDDDDDDDVVVVYRWLDDYMSKWENTLLVVSHDQDFLSSVYVVHTCLHCVFVDREAPYGIRKRILRLNSTFPSIPPGLGVQ